MLVNISTKFYGDSIKILKLLQIFMILCKTNKGQLLHNEKWYEKYLPDMHNYTSVSINPASLKKLCWIVKEELVAQEIANWRTDDMRHTKIRPEVHSGVYKGHVLSLHDVQ